MTATYLPSMKEIYGHRNYLSGSDAGCRLQNLLQASGIWAVRAPGPPITGLKLIGAGLMPVVHEAVFFPYNNPNLESGPKGESLTIRRSGNYQLY